MSSVRFIIPLVLSYILTIGCNLNVNETISISDGETVRGSQNTVNGSIIVGSRCEVRGDCRSVNGRIKVGENSQVKDLHTVNGEISIGNESIVIGDVGSVNGMVRCGSGVSIEGKITTVNGHIDIMNTEVMQDIHTYNGSITLKDKSKVRNDIIIKSHDEKSDSQSPLQIKIMDDSVVEGDIIVEEEGIEVQVYLSGGGKVNGTIENAKVIKES